METTPGTRKKIMVLLSRVPWPLEKGDKLRAYYQLRELSKNNDVLLCALTEDKIHPDAYKQLKPFAKEIHFLPISKSGIIGRLIINWLKSMPFQVAYFKHNASKRKILKLIEHYKPDHIYCQLIRMAHYVDGVDVDKTIDYQDVFSKGLERRMKISPWYMKPLLRIEYNRVAEYEKAVFDKFDKKTIISDPDRQDIRHVRKNEIVVIPNGVDTEFFHPMDLQKTFDLVFCGNMGYPPNINAAEYLVRKIMPLIWDQRPGTTLVLAGANPSASVKALASERVVVTGWVDDIRHYYGSSSIFIAPLQIGTGLQNKVLEAMAMQLPCIISPLANMALQAEEGKEILMGNIPGDYSEHVLSLLNDADRSNSLAISGYEFVHRNFKWESVCRKLETLILQPNNEPELMRYAK
jgi:polysaccharide biosynthesis protein PslH